MRRVILSFLFLTIPVSLLADTVIMKDGSRYRGTFLRGTARQITITDDRGGRRDIDLINVSQIYFGDSYDRNRSEYRDNPNNNNRDVTAAVARLQEDIRNALNTRGMMPAQRDSLERANSQLVTALNRYSAGARIDMPAVRSALADVRYVVDNGNLNPNDRQRLSDDLEQVREAWQIDMGGDRSRLR